MLSQQEMDDKHVLEPKYVNPVMKQVTDSGGGTRASLRYEF